MLQGYVGVFLDRWTFQYSRLLDVLDRMVVRLTQDLMYIYIYIYKRKKTTEDIL